MKIDLHCHTNATKGESKKRNIKPAELVLLLKQKGVEIVSITNHNQFDYDEYMEVIKLGETENIKVFPGIELDVIGLSNERAHVIIIVNPEQARLLDDSFGKNKISSPKDYTIDLVNLIQNIKNLDFIFVAHFQKNPELSEESLEYVLKVIDSYRVFLEPSNFRGLSINSNKGYSCLVGSDITDWSKYLDENVILPNLKLKIESFKEFILLAKKDRTIVETLLNRTRKVKIEVELKRDKEKKGFRTETLELYDDINVIFGGKGSGKSKYLEFIRESLKEKGENPVYYNSDNADSLINDYKKIQIDEFDPKSISSDIEQCDFCEIKGWESKVPTPLSDYFDAIKTNQNKRNRKYLSIIERSSLNNQYRLDIKKSKEIYEKISEFINWLTNDFDYDSIGIEKQKNDALIELLNEYSIAAYAKYKNNWIGKVSIDLANKAMNELKNETDILSNGVSIPNEAGLENMFINTIKPMLEIKKYNEFIKLEQVSVRQKFGTLEEDKILYLTTTFSPVNKNIKANIFNFKSKTINVLKKIDSHFKNVYQAFGTNDYYHQLVELQNTLNDQDICGLSEFVCISRRFSTEEDDYYTPSSGEAKVIAFQKALDIESKYYLLDEPEKSLGNSYTTSVILPQIKRLAQLGKCVVCTTHSANIAVLGMPYQTILKEYSNRDYLTYTGNMYLNKLYCISDPEKKYIWSEKSIELLEGGEYAFNERSYAYAIR